MTKTLQEALAAVKFANGQTGNVHFVATILKAVASGDLTPKSEAGADLEHGLQTPQPGEVPASSAPAHVLQADAELAVALAYQRGGEVCALEYNARMARQMNAGSLSGIAMMHGQVAEAMLAAKSAILALAPAEPLAEVARLQRWVSSRDEELDYLNRSKMREVEYNHELLSDFIRLKEALTVARQVVYQSSIDRTQPEEAEAALRMIDAALKGETP